MEPERSLLHSQEPATCPYPESYLFSPCPPIPLLNPYQISKMMHRGQSPYSIRWNRREKERYPCLIKHHTMKTYEWRHSSTHSEPQHMMESKGLLQSPVALPSEKDIPVPILFYLPVYFHKQFLSSIVNSVYIAISSSLKPWRWPYDGHKHFWSRTNCLHFDHLTVCTVCSHFTV
jgi:hypothetical protein